MKLPRASGVSESGATPSPEDMFLAAARYDMSAVMGVDVAPVVRYVAFPFEKTNPRLRASVLLSKMTGNEPFFF